MRQRESTRLVPLAEATPCPFCRQRLAELCPCDAPSCHPMLVESRTAQQVDAARAAMVLPADPAPAPTATEAAVAPCIADPAAIPAAAEMVFPIHPVANKPTADPAFAPSVPQSPATPTTTAPAEPGPATVEHTQSEPDACTIPAAPVAGTENGAQTPLPAPAKQAANTTMHAQALPRAAPTDANTSAETAAPPPIAATTAPTAAATAAPTHPAYYTLPRTPQLDSDAMSTDDSEAQSYETDAMDDLSTKSSESTMSDNESGAVLEPDTEEPSQAPVPLPPLPRMRNGARGTPAPSTAPGELSRRLSKVTKQVARKTDRAELSRIITRSGLPTQPRITTLVSPRPGIPREATLPEDKATDLDAGAPRL
ncbi:hypothetical protein H4R99_004461 [Coemansia sp. RSA 1722]|nr:hypothetical protein H4R99_004461 [Coemansia sp. RSA 1722]